MPEFAHSNPEKHGVLFPSRALPGSSLGMEKERSGKYRKPFDLTFQRGKSGRMARPERFELPTFWFVAVAALEINNLHGGLPRVTDYAGTVVSNGL